MGIPGLTRFVEEHGRPEVTLLRDAPAGSYIVIDGYAFYRQVGIGYPFTNGAWLLGGEYGPILEKVRQLLAPLQEAGVRCVVVFDGCVTDVKLGEWQRRRREDGKLFLKSFRGLEEGQLPKDWYPPEFFGWTVRAAYRACGAKVVRSLVDGDREAAALAQGAGCLGVLSEDSDFFIYALPRVFRQLDSTCLRGYPNGVVAELLNLEPAELPLFAVLAGNDAKGRLPPTAAGAAPKSGCRAAFFAIRKLVWAYAEFAWQAGDKEQPDKSFHHFGNLRSHVNSSVVPGVDLLFL